MRINIDADIENADWTKTTPDLQVRTKAELLTFLKDTGTDWAHFQTLPVYLLNKAYWSRIMAQE